MKSLYGVPLGMLAAIMAEPVTPSRALAQDGARSLPAVTVSAPRAARTPKPRPQAQRSPRRSEPVRRAAQPPVAPADPAQIPSGAAGVVAGGSLTQPTFAQAQREVERAPGAVQVVSSDTYRDTQRVSTVKDALDYVAGVFAQPKWGEDSRLSIRGSGLSRNFHLRGVQLYLDGVPFNTADGYGDFQEIDPGAYRFVEVYKGSNALRFGANALGGALNFVTPSGRDTQLNTASLDAGSFGYFRFNATAGGASGPWDGTVSGTFQRQDGFRDHSRGQSERGSANIGYRISPDIETRFYFNANHIVQRIPGAVTRTSALTSPETAAAINVANDWQRNIDSVRLANKTTIRLSEVTTLEVGAFGVGRHLMHPIFQWLDHKYADYGAFARVIDERMIGGYRNRFIAGVNVHNGSNDADNFVNGPNAQKGALVSRTKDTSGNTAVYAENSFYVLPSVALVTGTQFLNAARQRETLFGTALAGRTEFDLWSPKAGVLWDAASGVQVFANVSRSAEAPSFGESSSFPAPVIPFTQIKPQRATTYEAGTRGRQPDLTWDLALYRAEIRNELLCLYGAFGNCNVVNADRSLHQGFEAAAGLALWRGLFANGAAPDRLWLNAAYTFSDFRFRRDLQFGDNQLPGAPRHYLRAEMLYKHPSGFFAGPNVEWVPEAYFVDSANTLKTEPYVLWGLKAGVETKNLTFYVEGRNLANKAYIASASIIDRANPNSPLFEPGNGRAIYAGLRGKW